VKDVEVLQEDGTYAPLDLEATYTVASHNYLIQDCGDGFSMFEDNEMLIDKAAADYQMLITYITEKLDGDLSAYGSTEGRITVE
jgi:2',3'-cyclic-nucleotide 2'-phosphodiesterase (5'-nucleotidase family)